MTQKKHTKAVNRIALNPNLVGIEDAIMACQETSMFDSGGHLLTQADNLIFDAYGNVHVIEYKCNHDEQKAVQQLHKSSEVIQGYFGVKPVLWYVSGRNLHVKEVK